MSKSKTLCSAVPCQCGGQEAAYTITYPDGSRLSVSNKCADMHIMAGYECRPLDETIRSKMMNEPKTCGNCDWFEQDEYNEGRAHCYLEPPSVVSRGGSVRPDVRVGDKACRMWKEADEEQDSEKT